jgi:crossover junction endodeoxyribonuclease RusA
MIPAITLVMPWPVMRELSPNWRGHWARKASAKKKLRAAWAATALQQGARRIASDSLAVSLVFVPPDKRARDLDNLLASCKAGLDGLADVLGVDDSKWSLAISKAAEQGGFVRVEVSHAVEK